MTRVMVAAWLIAAAVRPAAAQDAPALRPHRFTVSAGVALLGGHGIGTATAALRRNETGTANPGSVTLFTADGSIERAPSVEARVGFTLTPTIVIEFGGSYSRPVAAVDISRDTEAGEVPSLTDQRLSQYIVEVSASWHITRLKLGRRARPYVTFGGGYLRQLDIDRVRAETGTSFHAGGGVRYWFRGGDARGRALGARAEVIAQTRAGGVDFEEAVRVAPAVRLLGFVGF
jgi:hypothetical protein